MIRPARLSHRDLSALVALLADRERRETLPLLGRPVLWLCRRELRNREALTAKANRIYRG